MVFSYNTLASLFTEDLPPAQKVAEKLGLHIFELEGVEEKNGDYLIDWDVLPNRSSDCLSYQGIANEIKTLFDLELNGLLHDNYGGKADFDSADLLDFTLNTDLVTHATKRVVTDLSVEQSPDWLQEFLAAIGQKSINNVVDITNYVMWMTGQPVHAFDLDKLAGGERKNMTIRLANKGEKVVDLTDLEHELDETMLVVADSEKALDVAGIKGGNNSGVDDKTTRIVVSACNFDFKNIRKTSRALKLHTDASKRFENEVPYSAAAYAQALCGRLLEKYAGGQTSLGYIDIGDKGEEQITIDVSLEKINSVLGVNLEEAVVSDIFKKIGFEFKEEGNLYTVSVDDRRPDLRIPEDIIEEVARVYGYYNIPATPLVEEFTIPKKHAVYQSRDRVADLLVSQGFYETISRTLTGSGVVELKNPLTSEAGWMRATLMPFLQNKVIQNFVNTDTPHFFEVGKVFTGMSDGVVNEHWSFAGILGRRKIKEKQKNDLFLQTKGFLETVFDSLRVKGVEWKEGVGETVAILEINGDVLGSVGVNWWELNFEELVAASDNTVSYARPSRFPKMDRDVAVWVPSDVRVQDVREIIDAAGADKCTDTQLFDVFEDTENKRKSLAFRLVFQSMTETLSDEYTNIEMDKVYAALSAQKGFEIR